MYGYFLLYLFICDDSCNDKMSSVKKCFVERCLCGKVLILCRRLNLMLTSNFGDIVCVIIHVWLLYYLYSGSIYLFFWEIMKKKLKCIFFVTTCIVIYVSGWNLQPHYSVLHLLQIFNCMLWYCNGHPKWYLLFPSESQ